MGNRWLFLNDYGRTHDHGFVYQISESRLPYDYRCDVPTDIVCVIPKYLYDMGCNIDSVYGWNIYLVRFYQTN